MKMDVNSKGKKAKRRIFVETFIVFFVIISPFIFKLHEFVSSDPEATVNFLGFSIDRNGFANVSIYAWFLLGKIVPLYLLLLWFFSCKHWWYHGILIPILMYTFQIFEVIFSEDNYVDTDNLLWLLPVCLVVVPFVYLIRVKLIDKYVHGIDLEAMEAELNSLKEKANYTPTTDEELERLKNNTIWEVLNRKLSTRQLEEWFDKFQHSLKNWLHLKF